MAREALRRLPLRLIMVFGVPVFALLNALAEEGIYRGVLQEALDRATGGTTLVLFIQASAYAAAHYAGGFPNGLNGYLMALAYGVALGFIRQWTGGMLGPFLAHFMADLTIGYILVLNP